MTKEQTFELLQNAHDWAMTQGLTSIEAQEYAKEVLNKELENPTLGGHSYTTDMSL